MKTRLFLFLTIILMVVSCGGNTDTNPSQSDIEAPDSDKNETPIPTPEPEKEPMPTSISFYQEMLDYFCKAYYKEDFDWNYIAGSIIIKQPMDFKDEDQVFVIGTHSYKDGLRKRGNREFRATILRTGKNEYEVTFEKKSRNLGGTQYNWEASCHTITYP